MGLGITIWNEFRHEKENDAVKAIYPDGIHEVIRQGLDDLSDSGEFSLSCATLDQPEHGLTPAVLQQTDVMLWWGHMAHDEVQDEIVEQVHTRVLEGMGLIVLHSAHYSKIFRKLMGTACNLKWRAVGERERIWVTRPGHAIARGIDTCIELDSTEMYGEPFGIPEPEEQVFISWFEGGEVFRSGCCWRRGQGKIFYFRPGHETYPIYHNPAIRQVLLNAVRWAKPDGHNPEPRYCENVRKPKEDIRNS